MGKFGYDFYFKIGDEVLTLPITPASFKMTIGSNNKVVTLINEGDINILKSPSLVEFEFEARFPMRKYPYSRDPLNFEVYMNKFTALMTEKTPFVLNVVRTTPNGKGTWATVRRVTLEDLDVNESADEGDDVLVSFNLKEYKEYGVVVHKKSTEPDTTSTSEKPRATDNKAAKPESYKVRAGDTLWAIAKAKYGNGAKWTAIYEANKVIIESTAEKNRGKGKGSSNGHWIYPNTTLVIPALSDANATIQTLKNNESNKTTKTYKVRINITSKNGRAGTVTLHYVLNGVGRTITKKDVSTTTVNVDSGSEVRVGISSTSGASFVIDGSSGLWDGGSNHQLYKIASIQMDSSLTIRWT